MSVNPKELDKFCELFDGEISDNTRKKLSQVMIDYIIDNQQPIENEHVIKNTLKIMEETNNRNLNNGDF